MQAEKPILIVDDDAGICAFVEAALVEEGYRVVSSSTGREALDYVRQNMPALVLLDLWMPELDGRGFLDCYAELPKPRAPVVIFAAAEELVPDLDSADVVAHLPKPVELTDLLNLVRQWVS